jgi:hypothetical protein
MQSPFNCNVLVKIDEIVFNIRILEVVFGDNNLWVPLEFRRKEQVRWDSSESEYSEGEESFVPETNCLEVDVEPVMNQFELVDQRTFKGKKKC